VGLSLSPWICYPSLLLPKKKEKNTAPGERKKKKGGKLGRGGGFAGPFLRPPSAGSSGANVSEFRAEGKKEEKGTPKRGKKRRKKERKKNEEEGRPADLPLVRRVLLFQIFSSNVLCP